MAENEEREFLTAIRNDDLSKVKQMMTTCCEVLWRRGLTFAMIYAKPKIVRFFITEHRDDVDVNQLLVSASMSGNLKLVELLIEFGATDFEKAASFGACFGNFEVIKILVDHGAKNFDDMMTNAASNRNHDMFKKIYDLSLSSRE